MATSTVYLKGTTGFVKLDTPDQYEKYVCSIKLDKKSKELYKKSGMRVTLKEDDLIYLRRATKIQKMDGEILEFGPPKVIDKDNNPLPPEEYSQAWTGAEVTCKVSVYDTSRGKGHRLEAVRIDKPSELADQAGEVIGDVDVPF